MEIIAILESPIFWVIVAAASEVVGMSKLKDNSVLQLIFTAINALKPKK
jgi:hypothetical protein